MKILFIGARLFEDVAIYAKKLGITSILTESNPESKNIELADIHYIVPRGMEGPKEIALKEDVDAVVPLIGIDDPLIDVARLKEDLESNYSISVIASPLNAVNTAGDKQKTKDLFIKNRINTPQYIDISNKLSKDEFPIVMKTLEGQGGRGVKIAFDEDDLVICKDDFRVAVAEKFINGIEISIEVLRYNGKTVSLVPVYKGKTTIECIHPLDKLKTAPLAVNNLDNEYIRKKAAEIANSLGSEGNIDIDIIFDENEAVSYFIEINARPSGTRYLTAASSDINPMHELVDMASGKWNPGTVEKRIKNYSALEIPIGNYKNEKNNYKFRNFYGKNSWIIHGHPDFQRITIRAESIENAFNTAKELNIDYKKFQ